MAIRNRNMSADAKIRFAHFDFDKSVGLGVGTAAGGGVLLYDPIRDLKIEFVRLDITETSGTAEFTVNVGTNNTAAHFVGSDFVTTAAAGVSASFGDRYGFTALTNDILKKGERLIAGVPTATGAGAGSGVIGYVPLDQAIETEH